MTDSDVKTVEWTPVPGAGYYETTPHPVDGEGRQIRSVDRTIGSRKYPSTVLKPRDGWALTLGLLSDAKRGVLEGATPLC